MSLIVSLPIGQKQFPSGSLLDIVPAYGKDGKVVSLALSLTYHGRKYTDQALTLDDVYRHFETLPAA